MGMTVAEANAIPITPPNLRAAADRLCDGERTILLRRAAAEIEVLLSMLRATKVMKTWPIPGCPVCNHPTRGERFVSSVPGTFNYEAVCERPECPGRHVVTAQIRSVRV